MDQVIGQVFKTFIIDENDEAYFLQKNGVTLRLSKTEGTYQIGDTIEGFAYPNQQQKICFTTQIPTAVNGQFAFATVKEVRRDLGVFVDVGLPDKDVAVSLDELPELKQLWPKKGDQLYVTLQGDVKGRLWAKLADEMEFQALSIPATNEEELHNKDIEGTVYRLKLAGTYILTTEHYLGFIHPSERFQEPRLGEVVKGRVIGLRPDGVLNLSLKPRAHEVIDDDAEMILYHLRKAPDGKIPFTDKTAPEEIKRQFAISKGQFKRAIGSLMKKGLVKQEAGFTILIEKKNSD